MKHMIDIKTMNRLFDFINNAPKEQDAFILASDDIELCFHNSYYFTDTIYVQWGATKEPEVHLTQRDALIVFGDKDHKKGAMLLVYATVLYAKWRTQRTEQTMMVKMSGEKIE